MINEKNRVITKAFYKNKIDRKKIVEEIVKKRKPFIIYSCLSEEEKDRKRHREWAYKNRKKILKELKEECTKCGSISNIQIHHIYYTNNLHDLKILCEKCHIKLHKEKIVEVQVEK